MKRGEIYYVEPSKQYQETGSEQRSNRPAIIVSNDLNNENAQTVEIVYLTTQPKKELPTHVQIMCNGRASTALCEQVSTVAIERLENYMGTCTDDEMGKINDAIMISLGVEVDSASNENEKYKELEEKYNKLKLLNDSLFEKYDMLATRWEILIQTYSDVTEQLINAFAEKLAK